MPIAPAVWGRIKAEALRGAMDPRLGTEIGRLALHADLTNSQAAAAFRVAEIYGRYEHYKGKRRVTASPSYETGRHGEAGLAEELMDTATLERRVAAIRAAEREFYALTGHPGDPDNFIEARRGEIPRAARPVLEALCVADEPINPTLLPQVCALLDHLAMYFGISRSTGERGAARRGGAGGSPLHFNKHLDETVPAAAVVTADQAKARPNVDRLMWIQVLRRVMPKKIAEFGRETMSDYELGQIYDTQQTLKAREVFRMRKKAGGRLALVKR